MNLEMLDEYGIRHEKGLARCMGDRGLYEAILSLFLDSDAFNNAKDALSRRDKRRCFNTCMN